jgi:UDP-N-acetylmuramate: L-alanyl-gamma-D-glutamyl-meso-diaminopimelate ligase
MELHTFSSLTKEFLIQYKGTMQEVDTAAIYFNSHALELKRLPNLDKDMILEAFDKTGLQVFTTTEEVLQFIRDNSQKGENILMMSSSNFGGLNLKELANEIIK